MRRLRLVGLVGLLVAAVFATRARGTAGAPAVLVDEAGGLYNGVSVTLAADRPPTPGAAVTLTLTARPLRDAPDLVVEWELPDGGTLLDGPLTGSLGPVTAGQSATATRRVLFASEGVYEVRARARYFPNDATSLAATGVLFFTVRPDEPVASDLDPRVVAYQAPPARTTIDKSRAAEAGIQSADGDPCFNVSGTIARANKLPYAVPINDVPPRPVPRYRGVYLDQTGSAVPVRNVVVELREEDSVSDDSYGHTVTGDLGRFTFNFCDGDGVLDDELELYYRVCAEVRAGSSLIAQVREWDSRNLYCWDSPVLESGGGDVDFDLQSYDINSTQAKVFNIAEAVYWAWRFWNANATQSPAFDRSVTVWWQDGRGEDGSYYSDDSTSMVIADDPSNRDEWDDSVIIHEWGHFADNQFSCYQNPGGSHSLPGMNNGFAGQRLAWGEGYPDYYQSAARSIMPGTDSVRFYVDPDGPTVDLENMSGVTASERDEGAIAAMLWDFFDSANDGQDTVSHGHAAIQRAYAAPDFKATLNCDVNYFLGMWRKLGLPADAATAAAVTQNVQLNLLTTTAPPTPTQAAEGDLAPRSSLAAPPLAGRWWDQVTMVVDTSASMAQPPGTPKINSVKAIIREQVNDLAANPRGTEFNLYTFDADTPLSAVFQRRFFAPQILPAVNALAATGEDAGCTVNGLNALSLAAADKFDGQVWLYTDGDEFGFTTPEPLRQALNERRLRGSIVLLGGCSTPPAKQSNVTGPERTYLDLAANGSQPTGMVPYLLTALGSGGQFIYVAPDQLANAVDIVRAQLSHSAGAGRWSDYVSNVYTYRWDRLEPWEYSWMPRDLGQDAGQFQREDTPLRLTPPAPIPFYGTAQTTLDLYLDGFIRMNPCVTFPDCPDFTQKFVNPLYANLDWKFVGTGPRLSPEAPAAADEDGYQVHAYTTNYAFQWYIVSTEGIADYNPDPQIGDYDYRGFQVWFNYVTGEIRFLYDKLRNEAGGAFIGLENDTVLFKAGNVIVSQNDLGGATSGMGYKFTPAPPQPTRVYDVNVDPLIQSVVFLQTGYSGDFAPMTVTRPNGAPVDCNDAANVRCLTMNNKPGDRMVQFVQVNTNGESGVYTATVAVGPSGSGTFSFNALAASDLQASSPGRHTLSLADQTFIVDLGRPVAGNALDGWLQTPAGKSFGATFTLYDDGAHGDGAAGDGRFGSQTFSPPRSGAAYLWVKGVIDGAEFQRSDPVPYNFQPLQVWANKPYREDYYPGGTTVTFHALNQDTVEHCYYAEFTVPDGWSADSLFTGDSICLAPGESVSPYAWVSRSLTPDSRGEIADVGFTMTEVYEGSISGTASTRLALSRRPAAMEFDNRQTAPLRPNGTDTLELTLRLVDDLGQAAVFNGPFDAQELSATLGTLDAPTGMFEDGRLKLIFTAGNTPGIATIRARMANMTATTTVLIAPAAADSLEILAAPADLANATTSNLTVTLRDSSGQPMAGRTIRLSVSNDDGTKGTFGGDEVFEGATNSAGQMKARFTKTPGAAGTVVVRAELLDDAGAVVRETSLVLRLSAPPGGAFLPAIFGVPQ